jgi:hypothetical protein
MTKRRKKGGPLTDADLSELFKWKTFSTYHPSWNPDDWQRDWASGKSLRQVYAERGETWEGPGDDQAN